MIVNVLDWIKVIDDSDEKENAEMKRRKIQINLESNSYFVTLFILEG